MRRLVRSTFGVRLQGLDLWGNRSVCDAMLYGDGRFKLLNDNRHIPMKVGGFYVFNPDTGASIGGFKKISRLGAIYRTLEGKAIRLHAIPAVPGTQWPNGFQYEGIVSLELRG